MLQSKYLTEADLKDFGFKSLSKNVRISSDARIYGAHNISIGNNVRIDDFVILVAVKGSITIGNYVFIARNSHLNGSLGIEIHDFSTVATNTIIHSASDDYTGKTLTGQVVPPEFVSYKGGKVVIGKHVIIGCSCTIIGPSHLGEGCSIGTMTFINNNLLPWGIYVGIPCRRIKERKKDLLEFEKELIKKYNPFTESN